MLSVLAFALRLVLGFENLRVIDAAAAAIVVIVIVLLRADAITAPRITFVQRTV